MTSRGFLAARKDLVQELSKLASERHLKLFRLVNENIEQVIRVLKMKEDLKEILDEHEMIKIMKETGSIILPREVALWLMRDEERRKDLEDKWKEAGEWYGKLVKAKFHHKNSMEAIESFLKGVLWGVSDLSITKEGGLIIVRCISPAFHLSYTGFIAQFIEGIFSSFGYELAREDVSKGLVMLTFKKESS